MPKAMLGDSFVDPNEGNDLNVSLFLTNAKATTEDVQANYQGFPRNVFSNVARGFTISKRIACNVNLAFRFTIRYRLRASVLFMSGR